MLGKSEKTDMEKPLVTPVANALAFVHLRSAGEDETIILWHAGTGEKLRQSRPKDARSAKQQVGNRVEKPYTTTSSH